MLLIVTLTEIGDIAIGFNIALFKSAAIATFGFHSFFSRLAKRHDPFSSNSKEVLGQWHGN